MRLKRRADSDCEESHPTPSPSPHTNDIGGLFIYTASNAMLNSAIENFNGFGAFTTIGGTCVCVCIYARQVL